MQPLPRYLLKPMVLLLAWPGPLPMVHSHDEYRSRPQTSHLLAEHVALFHCERPDEHDASTEPHCHWVLRWVAMEGTFFDAAQYAQDVQTASAAERQESSLEASSVAVLCHVVDAGSFMSLGALESMPAPSLCAPVGLQMHQELCRWVC
jgi:hypothetical protein